MPSSIDHLRSTTMDLRRITSNATLLLVARPALADVEALRGMRTRLVSDLARFQEIVHEVLIEAMDGDTAMLAQAIDLKIGAIALGQAYIEFRQRWADRHFLSNWPEYRFSAKRMIQTIHDAIDPVDLLSATGHRIVKRHQDFSETLAISDGMTA